MHSLLRLTTSGRLLRQALGFACIVCTTGLTILSSLKIFLEDILAPFFLVPFMKCISGNGFVSNTLARTVLVGTSWELFAVFNPDVHLTECIDPANFCRAAG